MCLRDQRVSDGCNNKHNVATRLIGDLPGRARSTRSQAYNDLLADHDVVYVVKVPSAATLPSEGAALTFWGSQLADVRNGRARSRWNVREKINPSFLSTQIRAGPLREYPSRTCWTRKPSSAACFMQDHLPFAGLPPIPPRNLLFAGPPPIRKATPHSQGYFLFARPPLRKATSHSQNYLLFARPPPIRKATSHSQNYLLFARPPPIRRAAYPIRRAISHSVQFKIL